jgi:cyclophilin family peptidyl-prolyl cis-trans isomerase
VFHCKLEHELVPRTVANFVGLAEGSRAWVNFQRGGRSRKPFYDGLTFHRVVTSPEPFIIQSGSPNGVGTDGPGYTFRDEFDPALRHSEAGVLSMANSGLNSNGAQFFVTLNATTHLDDAHNVFGVLVGAPDLAVVQTIQQGDVIDRVTITRNGGAALAFDADAHGLPSVEEAGPILTPTQSGFELAYQRNDDAEYYLFHTDDFSDWRQILGKEFYFDPPTQSPRDVSSFTAGKSEKFFNATRVQYPDALITPAVGAGKRIAFTDSTGFTFTFDLTGATTGAYETSLVPSDPPFDITSYSWNREAYRGHLTGAVSGLAFANGTDPVVTLNLSLDFGAPTSGALRGYLESVARQRLTLNGTFTLSDL